MSNRHRTSDVEGYSTFSALGINELIYKSLGNMGWYYPSPVQLKGIPAGINGLDLLIQSKSGTGKTGCFAILALECVLSAREKADINSVQGSKAVLGVPALPSFSMGTNLSHSNRINAGVVLILSPTRELSTQVSNVVKDIISGMDLFNPIQISCIIGGMSIENDRNILMSDEPPEIIIATPGRLLHLLREGTLGLEFIELLIFDEADKMFDSGFIDQSKAVLNLISSTVFGAKKRPQLIACSATYSKESIKILKSIMQSPSIVRLNADSPVLLGVRKFLWVINDADNLLETFREKTEIMLRVLKRIPFNQCLVFCRDPIYAKVVSSILNDRGFATQYISGLENQRYRNEVIRNLRNFEIRVLLTTDLLARGIDLQHVTLVINLDISKDFETFLHRIGRTGRFGSIGLSLTIISNSEQEIIKEFEIHFKTSFQRISSETDLDLQTFAKSSTDYINNSSSNNNNINSDYKHKEKNVVSVKKVRSKTKHSDTKLKHPKVPKGW